MTYLAPKPMSSSQRTMAYLLTICECFWPWSGSSTPCTRIASNPLCQWSAMHTTSNIKAVKGINTLTHGSVHVLLLIQHSSIAWSVLAVRLQKSCVLAPCIPSESGQMCLRKYCKRLRREITPWSDLALTLSDVLGCSVACASS